MRTTRTSLCIPLLARHKLLRTATLLVLCGIVVYARAAEPSSKKAPVEGVLESTSANTPEDVGNQLRQALGLPIKGKKALTIEVNSGAGKASGSGATENLKSTPGTVSKAAARAKALALASNEQEVSSHGEVHWSYEGDTGPAKWAQLKPEFNLCAIGKRQSPINIDEEVTLKGPAEPLRFNYVPSSATVLNNGHTIQVDVQGENFITVRGMRYRLVQFHFHTPSEEQINGQRYAMVAHLVHKSEEGALAVVAVLLQPGEPNPMIDKVWTYIPLDVGDQVRMPRDLLNLNELLPTDQRYYQFVGSLTTPPCTEGVLWMVLKQPVTISRAQYRLFTQLYSGNARPIQPLNGRVVRDAQ
ncbi:carbonic anhydrase family protein [Curvibacter sp. CHRR-16]|uniref:carbonic anhydrase n=1 Tax=Curvibacter sp. CHRR-16 TaxID=2835872 RepID=UPI001BDB2887|nr:carbonic anhydrase family protein [Curvibacter sp. CHRR-16]MBT0569878.1 carbonic anhydrase family protein [Curvibacter sp. CHRR-16]